MTAATITQAQDKGLRHQFGALLGNVRDFAVGLYAAHGGWLAPATHDQAQTCSNPSTELRYLASRG